MLIHTCGDLLGSLRYNNSSVEKLEKLYPCFMSENCWTINRSNTILVLPFWIVYLVLGHSFTTAVCVELDSSTHYCNTLIVFRTDVKLLLFGTTSQCRCMRRALLVYTQQAPVQDHLHHINCCCCNNTAFKYKDRLYFNIKLKM